MERRFVSVPESLLFDVLMPESKKHFTMAVNVRRTDGWPLASPRFPFTTSVGALEKVEPVAPVMPIQKRARKESARKEQGTAKADSNSGPLPTSRLAIETACTPSKPLWPFGPSEAMKNTPVRILTNLRRTEGVFFEGEVSRRRRGDQCDP